MSHPQGEFDPTIPVSVARRFEALEARIASLEKQLQIVPGTPGVWLGPNMTVLSTPHEDEMIKQIIAIRAPSLPVKGEING
jgi:hypothetical protein